MTFGGAPQQGKGKKTSVGFCWGFCAVVCLTFGMASFLMLSAWGRFSGMAWGSVENEDVIASEGFITVEISEAERDAFRQKAASADPEPKKEPEVASLPLSMLGAKEDFGPLPRYLSDYESIVLNVQDDGTRIPEVDEGEDLSGLPEPAKEEEDVHLVKMGAAWREHVVKGGETLSDIALAYGGLTAQDILRANGLKDANRLSENQLLLIPIDASKIEDTLDEVRTRQMRVAAIKEKVEPLKVKSYVVAPGDSLWSISNSQNIELDTLVGSNTFKTSAKLRPGAVLRIPNQDGIFYTLRKGEKVEDVCKRYGVNLNKLRQVNPTVDMVSIKAGEEIFLPGARPDALADGSGNDDAKKAEKGAPEPKKAARKLDIPIRNSGSGAYRWPLMGRINSPFGWRQHPITKRRDFHTGIDIKADRGTIIRGAGTGQVAYSGWMGGYGKVLVINHANGQSTLYAHCSELLVGQGVKVKTGDNIARVGTTGRSTGPHLHFEVRSGNSPVNPLKYLK